MYPGVRKAWNENLLTLKQHGYAELGHAVNRFLDKTKVKYFRVHVAGDFIDQKHLVTWVQIAYTHPETKFLAFTKNMMLDYRCLPKNLIIRRSEWPNWYPLQTLSCMMLPRARVSDGPFYAEGSNKKGADEYWCPGSCTNCKVCWEQPKRNIVFEKH
jgi:hypothetical protein